jgi:outer membrane protein OmpA-like peptidoglycan-associated protein
VIDITPEGEDIVAVEGAGAEDGKPQKFTSVQLKLQPLLVGANLTLKDILFETNSDQLNEISFTELERVVGLMKENPGLAVEINAHTDDVGSASYNLALSDRRAQSVVDFLIESNINQDRFTARGLGESQPVVPNDTEENKAKNRRVVLKIVKV